MPTLTEKQLVELEQAAGALADALQSLLEAAPKAEVEEKLDEARSYLGSTRGRRLGVGG